MTKLNPLEEDVKKGIKRVLDKHNMFWFMPPGNGYGKKGVSDFIAIKAGVFFAIEAKKSPKEKPTPLQRAFLTSISAEDGYGFVVDTEKLPFFEEFMDIFWEMAGMAQRKEPESAEKAARLIDLLRYMSWEIV